MTLPKVSLCALSAAPRKAEAAAWFNCQAMDVFEFSNNAGLPVHDDGD